MVHHVSGFCEMCAPNQLFCCHTINQSPCNQCTELKPTSTDFSIILRNSHESLRNMATFTGCGPRRDAGNLWQCLRLCFNGDENEYEIWETKFLGHLRMLGLKDTILGSTPATSTASEGSFTSSGEEPNMLKVNNVESDTSKNE